MKTVHMCVLNYSLLSLLSALLTLHLITMLVEFITGA